MLAWIWRSMTTCGKRVRDEQDLSEMEMQSIREAWLRAKKRGIGIQILRALLELKPQFKEYFGIKFHSEDFMMCEAFQIQAARIENFLDVAVNTLGFGPTSNVYAMAKRIGQIHFYRGVNFGADNWLAFKKVTVEQVLSDTRTRSLASIGKTESLLQIQMNGVFPAPLIAAVAWEKFMGSIVREMKKGFLEEACRNCAAEREDE